MKGKSGKVSLLLQLAIWIPVVLTVAPEGLDYVALYNRVITGGLLVTKCLWLALLALGIYKSFNEMPTAAAVLKRVNVYLLIFVALAAASFLWSIDSGATIKRVIRLFTVVVLCLGITSDKWNSDGYQQIMRPLLTLFLLVSLVFGLIAPDLAQEKNKEIAELAGAWHGLATQKNGLGGLASLGALIWMHTLMSRRMNIAASLAGVILSFTMIILSRSSSALMAAVFGCMAMALMMKSPASMKRTMPYMIGALVVMILLYSLAVLQLIPGISILLQPVTAITGKDLTFSGRTEIWAIMRDHIAVRPYIGNGYGAYWTGVDGRTESFTMLLKLFFYPTEAHNGYLDVINDLGMVGGAILVAYLVTFLRQALKLYAVDRAQGALFLTLLLHQMIGNLSESRWFNTLCPEFVVMTLATFAVARGLHDARNRTLAAPVALAAETAGAAGGVVTGRPVRAHSITGRPWYRPPGKPGGAGSKHRSRQ